jgi:hypothetical protein
MPQDLVVSLREEDSRASIARQALVLAPRQPRLTPCSEISGRERWHVDILENNPRLAATVELVLQMEESVEAATVNPVTGRVLVRYNPRTIARPVKSLLSDALNALPLTLAEFSLLRSKRSEAHRHIGLLGIDAGCFLIHTIMLGGFCPFGLASAAILLLRDRARHSGRRAQSVRLDHSGSAVMN